MSKKLIRRVFATLSAMVMAVTMMATSASAAEASWNVYYKRSATQPGAPIISQKSYYFVARATTTIYYFQTNCTRYWSNPDYSSGDPGYAQLYAVRYDPRGIDPTIVVSNDYNVKVLKESYVTRTLSTPVVFGYDLRIFYNLVNPNYVYCDVAGNVKTPIGDIYRLYI